MQSLTDAAIRGAFINTTKRETRDAILPDLDTIEWDQIDLLGWRDRKKDNTGYAVVELDGTPVGVRFTTARLPGARRKALCSWCQDVIVSDDVTMYVARRGGAAGRKGDTIGTLICSDFGCSRNVRRKPTLTEVGSADEQDRRSLIAQRIDGLRERSAGFVRQVLATC